VLPLTLSDTTGWYHFPGRVRLNNVVSVSIATEPETLGELIADCAQIPRSLHTEQPLTRTVPVARSWEVDDRCHAQVAELEHYV
jgi:hypothetical protein